MCNVYWMNVTHEMLEDYYQLPPTERFSGLDCSGFEPGSSSRKDKKDKRDLFPGSINPVICRRGGKRELIAMRWGFNLTIQKAMTNVFNAKSENALESKMWRHKIHNRCIVPATAFIERKKNLDGKPVAKFALSAPDRQLISFAGIWAEWENPKTNAMERTYTIFTTPPNDLVKRYHHRQPVILEQNEIDEWISPAPTPPLHLLKIFPAEKMAIERLDPAPEPMLFEM